MCNQILMVCRLPTVLAEKISATFSHRSSERISCKVTPIVWQVIDDQTSDSPKSWAKTLKDTNVGTLLDHEIFKKGSNKICAKIFCAGPEAQVNVLGCSCFLPLSFILHSNFTKLSRTYSEVRIRIHGSLVDHWFVSRLRVVT